MSDDDKKSELTDSQRKYGGWDDAKHQEYVEARNKAMMDRIFSRHNAVNPVTGRQRRPLRVEQGPGIYGWTKTGYSPHSRWRSKRKNPYSDE